MIKHNDSDQVPIVDHASLQQQWAMWAIKTDVFVSLRAISEADVPLIHAFHSSLSEQSVYLRYFRVVTLRERTDPARLERICHVDPTRETVLVVEHVRPITEIQMIIGVGRLNVDDCAKTGEFALIVSDHYQGYGIGTMLLKQIIQTGLNQGLTSVWGNIHPENSTMLHICKRMRFQFERLSGDPSINATIDLSQ